LEQREALILASVGSYEEAAEILKCPLGTLKSRVARARASMKALMLDDSDTHAQQRLPRPRAEGAPAV
jgi:RNA polymerase sigma-70 factor (ECF subfamily)